MSSETIPPCPKCGGAMWDERGSKFYKPGKPVYKCKQTVCAKSGGVIFAQKEQTAVAHAPVQTSARTGPTATVAPTIHHDDVKLLAECLEAGVRAVRYANKQLQPGEDIVFTGDNVCSIASTLFIQSQLRVRQR